MPHLMLMLKKILIILTLLIIFGGLAFYLFMQPFFAITSPHSLKFDNYTFTNVANDIIRQHEIFEMDDCSRHIKRLNGINIRMTEQAKGSDTVCCPDKDCCPLFYKKILDSLNIDNNLFENIKGKLINTKLYSFYKSQDSVLFIVDGFLDNSWGFFYNPKALTNDTNYFKFGNYSVKFVDSINQNWRRAAIN